MLPNARDAYLETQVLTATPQRLRLMLIEGAILSVNAAQADFAQGNDIEAVGRIGRCRDVVAELIAGITAEQTPLARQILSVYMFLYSTLVEAQIGRDPGRLPDILRVLEEERQTWREVCVQMPERLVAAANPVSSEELAPQRVADSWSSSYVPAPNARLHRESALSLDA